MKICNACNTQKELNEYHTNNALKDGKKSICKTCCIEKDKVYRANNKRGCSSTKKWRKNNKEKINALNKMWRNENKEKEALELIENPLGK